MNGSRVLRRIAALVAPPSLALVLGARVAIAAEGGQGGPEPGLLAQPPSAIEIVLQRIPMPLLVTLAAIAGISLLVFAALKLRHRPALFAMSLLVSTSAHFATFGAFAIVQISGGSAYDFEDEMPIEVETSIPGEVEGEFAAWLGARWPSSSAAIPSPRSRPRGGATRLDAPEPAGRPEPGARVPEPPPPLEVEPARPGERTPRARPVPAIRPRADRARVVPEPALEVAAKPLERATELTSPSPRVATLAMGRAGATQTARRRRRFRDRNRRRESRPSSREHVSFRRPSHRVRSPHR